MSWPVKVIPGSCEWLLAHIVIILFPQEIQEEKDYLRFSALESGRRRGDWVRASSSQQSGLPWVLGYLKLCSSSWSSFSVFPLLWNISANTYFCCRNLWLTFLDFFTEQNLHSNLKCCLLEAADNIPHWWELREHLTVPHVLLPFHILTSGEQGGNYTTG